MQHFLYFIALNKDKVGKSAGNMALRGRRVVTPFSRGSHNIITDIQDLYFYVQCNSSHLYGDVELGGYWSKRINQFVYCAKKRLIDLNSQ